MRRDKFQTAGRMAEAIAREAPPDPRELMRPRTAGQIREEEFHRTIARREFGRSVAGDSIALALARMLWPAEYGTPTTLDANILVGMDDDDVREFTQENADRLIRFRDNLREKFHVEHSAAS